MSHNGPIVSVLMAVHNGESFLAEAIQSFIDQDYKHAELIVVDNASTDGTSEIVKGFVSSHHDSVRHFFLPQKGKIQAYNFAYKQSKGIYICFFAADDILGKSSLSQRLTALEAKSESYFSTCLLETISEDVSFNGLVYPKNKRRPNFSGGSIFFSRDMANRIFPIPEFLPNEDTWSSLYLRAYGQNVHIAMPLYLYRIHTGNSYGYGLTFEEKKKRFLERMQAYRFFYERNRQTEGKDFVGKYVRDFVRALDYLSERKLLSILLLKYLPIGDKLKFMMFSSKIIFRIRNRFFSLFSGLFN